MLLKKSEKYGIIKTTKERSSPMPSVDMLNHLHISSAPTADRLFSVLWIMASDYDSRSTQTFHLHTHTFFEAHYILKGSVTYGFEDGSQTVRAGELVLISPNESHRVDSVSEDFIKVTLACEAHDIAIQNSLLTLNRRTMPLHAEERTNLSFVIMRADSKTPCTDSILKSRLCECVWHLLERTSYTPLATIERDDRILKAKRYIEDNPHILFTCAEIADLCHLSEKQLGRLFRRQEEKRLLEYIHEIKLAQIKERLQKSDSSQEIIARELGFSGVQYFNKFFTRLMGVTPNEYRSQK